MQDHSNTVLDFLQADSARQTATCRISWGKRSGILKIHNNVITAAQTENLHGVAAALYMCRWQNASIDLVDNHTPTKKKIGITLDKVRVILQKLRFSGITYTDFDQEGLVDQAVQQIHRFCYPEAGGQLISIIKRNRFDYNAWFWYSRLLSRFDVIEKAVAEAKRWSGNDQAVKLEAQKLEIGRKHVKGSQVKRCVFCWTPLNPTDGQCCFCRAELAFGQHGVSAEVRTDVLHEAENRYKEAFTADKDDSRVAYTLALIHYNLGDCNVALAYLDAAVRLAPAKTIYSKARQVVAGLAAAGTSAPTPAPSQEKPVPQKSAAKTDRQKPLILVVEDSPTARKVITVVLDRAGYEYIEAASGEEALRKAQDTTPSLVLLDVMLPDTNGYDVLEKMRDFSHMTDTPVVMLTGRKGSQDRRRGLLAGSADYLTKPFNPHKLTSTIKRFL